MLFATAEVSEAATQAWKSVLAWCDRPLFTVSEIAVTPFMILGLLLSITIALVVSWIVRRGLARLAERRGSMARGSVYALGRILHYVLLATGTMIGLTAVGIDLTRLTLLISALGVGIGFGLQQIFSNFFSGLILLFERSLKVGDWIELESGLFGQVTEISIRATIVKTSDEIEVVVPNSEFINGRVNNLSLRDTRRRIRVPFGVAYGTDKELVRKAALEAAEAVEATLREDPARKPEVWLVGFGDSSLDFQLVVWIDQLSAKGPMAMIAAYNWEIESALARYDIEIPFPQRDLHVRSLFGAKDDEGMKLLPERQ